MMLGLPDKRAIKGLLKRMVSDQWPYTSCLAINQDLVQRYTKIKSRGSSRPHRLSHITIVTHKFNYPCFFRSIFTWLRPQLLRKQIQMTGTLISQSFGVLVLEEGGGVLAIPG